MSASAVRSDDEERPQYEGDAECDLMEYSPQERLGGHWLGRGRGSDARKIDVSA